MPKKLAFGGKGLDLVVGSRVTKKHCEERGSIQNIKFSPNAIPSKFQIRWDSGLTTWVKRTEIRDAP